ncbi:sulfatase [Bacteroidota bacterium]
MNKLINRFLGFAFILELVFGCKSTDKSSSQEDKKPNVLFIIVDDLRNDLGCYDNPVVKTPNIDKLAEEGLVFSNAYCQVPVSGASRACLLTGLRPTADRFKNYYTRHDEDAPGITSLPGHLKNNGYMSVSRGKVYHHIDDAIDSWSDEPWDAIDNQRSWRDYALEDNIILQNDPEINSGPAYECVDVNDEAYRDGKFAHKVIEDLKNFKKSGKPFFLALGFVKPHLPFNAPKKYWDLYNENEIELAPNPFAPENAPEQAMHNFGELRAYTGIPKEGPIPDSIAKKLIHGYYASTSYIDSMIGKVLHSLDTLGMSENTIIVLLADHGWHLGEHGLWCKHCNFDKVLRVPLIIKAPGFNEGEKTIALTELIDLYPTLCDLCEIDKPDHLDGKSLMDILKNPENQHKNEIYSRYHAGETVIDHQYAYTEWYNKESDIVARMLYDHHSDYDENKNIAELSENSEIVKKLSKRLKLNREYNTDVQNK